METKNTYAKYCPNVYLAKCEQRHAKGATIEVETKYGKMNECIVHNLILERGGFYYYSITRADGFNTQERAKAKAQRYQQWSANAEARSHAAWEASHEGRDFLSLAEPIKVGHHSEKRHRALIRRNNARMDRCVQEQDKAASLADKSAYWETQTGKIDLSMPESIEYFEYKVAAAEMKQEGIKNGTIPREHSYSLAYATKDVKEAKKNLEIAKKLWS